MNRSIIFCIVSLLSYSNLIQAQIKTITLNSNTLPKEIKYSGKLKQAIRWTDNTGDHIVICTETGVYRNPKTKHNNDGSDAALFAAHFLLNNSWEQTWKLNDGIQDCPVDLEASFIKNTLRVTDLNADGVAEIWVMYKTVCHGDVSPLDMKIIMYQGQQKYAMRGQNKVRVSDKEYVGGEYRFDPVFTDGPKAFRDYALTLWNKNLMETWGQ